jgi:hypothetical protein
MRRLSYAIATGAITAGLLAPATTPAAAQAAPTATPVLTQAGTSAGAIADRSAAPRWFTLWSGHKKGKSMISPGKKNRARVLQTVIQCWNGGDGTKAWVQFERRRYGVYYRASKSRAFPCNGRKHYYRVSSAQVGFVYRVHIRLQGKSHTMRAWMQNYG